MVLVKAEINSLSPRRRVRIYTHEEVKREGNRGKNEKKKRKEKAIIFVDRLTRRI